MAGGRIKPERSIKEGRNESGRNEDQERGSGTRIRNEDQERNAEIYRFGLQGET